MLALAQEQCAADSAATAAQVLRSMCEYQHTDDDAHDRSVLIRALLLLLLNSAANAKPA
jgi:hypothetical protein